MLVTGDGCGDGDGFDLRGTLDIAEEDKNRRSPKKIRIVDC